MNITCLMFEDFETLDVFGPVEIFGRLQEHYQVSFCSMNGGPVKNSHGVTIITERISELKNAIDIFLIPGGHGTRTEVDNIALVTAITDICNKCKFVLTVCTGTALLAKTGLLDGRQATTNKRAFDWVTTHGEKVNWLRKARWTQDGKFYTSAGVSAGIDMSLGFLSDIHGIEFARKVAFHIEYIWLENKEDDIFYLQ